MAEERTGTLEGAGGVRVFFRGREVKVPRGRLFVAHGLGEHSGRYGLLAEAITAAGLDYYALDLRGHGGGGQAADASRPCGPESFSGFMLFADVLFIDAARLQRILERFFAALIVGLVDGFHGGLRLHC